MDGGGGGSSCTDPRKYKKLFRSYLTLADYQNTSRDLLKTKEAVEFLRKHLADQEALFEKLQKEKGKLLDELLSLEEIHVAKVEDCETIKDLVENHQYKGKGIYLTSEVIEEAEEIASRKRPRQIEMGESQQDNKKMGESHQDSKKKMQYEAWNKEQSDELLNLMVEGARKGWRDNSGIFSKQTVEDRILPVLNKKLNCNKTYAHYQSRLKWFKARWTSYSNLMKFSSGFGYDATTKRITAPDEVWDAYLAVHSKDTNMRYAECSDYEDLKIALGNGVSVGKNSIRLSSVSTDARTLTLEDDKGYKEEDFNFDFERNG